MYCKRNEVGLLFVTSAVIYFTLILYISENSYAVGFRGLLSTHNTSCKYSDINMLYIVYKCLLKKGKACGVDGKAAEHFIYAHSILHVFLSLPFNYVIVHGYLPSDFMKTFLVPIIKCKTGNSSDKNNYRSIVLVTAASELFEI